MNFFNAQKFQQQILQTVMRARGMIYFIIINKNHKKCCEYLFTENFCVVHDLNLSGILNDYLLTKA